MAKPKDTSFDFGANSKKASGSRPNRGAKTRSRKKHGTASKSSKIFWRGMFGY